MNPDHDECGFCDTGGVSNPDYKDSDVGDVIDYLSNKGWNYRYELFDLATEFFSSEFFFMKIFGIGHPQDRINNEIKAIKVCSREAFNGFPHYFGSGTIGDRSYIIMSHFDGEDVASLIDNIDFDLNSLVPYFPALAKNIGALHSVGFIHRDIKPDNLLLLPDGIGVLDLGYACPYKEANREEILFVCGSPAYMSPENTQGLRLTSESDVYSLGMTLYEMVTGIHPFRDARSVKQVMDWQIEKVPRPLVEVANVSQGLSDVVMKSLAKDPAERFRNGKEMAVALERVC